MRPSASKKPAPKSKGKSRKKKLKKTEIIVTEVKENPHANVGKVVFLVPVGGSNSRNSSTVISSVGLPAASACPVNPKLVNGFISTTNSLPVFVVNKIPLNASPIAAVSPIIGAKDGFSPKIDGLKSTASMKNNITGTNLSNNITPLATPCIPNPNTKFSVGKALSNANPVSITSPINTVSPTINNRVLTIPVAEVALTVTTSHEIISPQVNEDVSNETVLSESPSEEKNPTDKMAPMGLTNEHIRSIIQNCPVPYPPTRAQLDRMIQESDLFGFLRKKNESPAQPPSSTKRRALSAKTNDPEPVICTTRKNIKTKPQGKRLAGENPPVTLVFFDLETTGLAHEIGKYNVQITEISMVAMNRKDFNSSTSPDLKDVRIIQKISLCTQPRSSISSGAARVTGLNDFNLMDQKAFDTNTATVITAFLSHLPKPVCLLAHNGANYDYPLLKAELNRLSVHLSSDIFIADTLQAFRALGVPVRPVEQIPKSVKYGKTGISYALENLHLYLFGKKPASGHSSEGDCIALAKVCHAMKDLMLPWIDENCFIMETVKPMW